MPGPGDHIARLCQSLKLLRRVAPAAELDELVARAEAGADIGDRLTDLFRRAGLSEPAPHLRGSLAAGLPGSDRGTGHFVPSGYVCPVGRCTAWRRRYPGGPRPFCELERVDMHEFMG